MKTALTLLSILVVSVLIGCAEKNDNVLSSDVKIEQNRSLSMEYLSLNNRQEVVKIQTYVWHKHRIVWSHDKIVPITTDNLAAVVDSVAAEQMRIAEKRRKLYLEVL